VNIVLFQRVVRPYFIKHPPFLGALGAWLFEMVKQPQDDYSRFFAP
jgi:pantothenate kinase